MTQGSSVPDLLKDVLDKIQKVKSAGGDVSEMTFWETVAPYLSSQEQTELLQTLNKELEIRSS